MTWKISTRILLCALFSGCGFLGNWYKVNLFFNVDFLFGSAFALLALLLLGRTCGVVVAVISGTCTYLLWNHPWAIVIFTGEVIFVWWLYARRRGNLVIYDLIYWLCLGMPMVYLFYFHVMGSALQSTVLVMLKQSVNGLTNALLATLAFILLKYLNKSAGERTAYSELIFAVMLSFALLPTILLSVSAIRTYQANRMESLTARVTSVSEAAHTSVAKWIAEHHNNVQILSSLVGDPNSAPFESMQHQVEILKSATHAFKGMGVFDNRSFTVSYSPLEQDGKSTLGVDMSARAHIAIMRREKKPFITDMLMSKLGDPSPIAILLAPIIISGEYKGYSSGVVETAQILAILANLQEGNTHITLIDGQNRVIVSTLPDLQTMGPFARPYCPPTGAVTNDETLLWRPDALPNITLMQLWRSSFLFRAAPISEKCRWRVIVEASLLPLTQDISRYSLTWLSMQGLLILAAVLFSFLLSNRFISNVKKLQQLTRSLPENIGDTDHIAWPDSTVAELAELSNNFQQMTGALVKHIAAQKMTEEALRDSLAEKVSLLKEVHHRVKNNLQIVASLLGLQAGRSDNRQVVDVLQDTRNRVKSMALLHEALYRSENLARINLDSYLRTLCKQLLNASGPLAARVRLDFHVATVGLPLEPALPCGLIVNELVSNALKHGFPGERRGQIVIGLALTGEQTLVLSVHDDGVGVPSDFNPASLESLGMRLVSGLVSQLGGQLHIETPQGGGVSFSAVFPLPEDSQVGGHT